MAVNPDAPTTREEYEAMKADALRYGEGTLGPLQREDRAFLLYELRKYEIVHQLPYTFPEKFTRAELVWWQGR